MIARRSLPLRPLVSLAALMLVSTSCSKTDEESDADNEPAVTPRLIDVDGDGIPDGIDNDGDGEIDVVGVGVDADGDGTFDGIDTDGDGVVDVTVTDVPGDGDGDLPVTGDGDTGGTTGDGDEPGTGGTGIDGTGGVVIVEDPGDGNGGGGNTPPGFASCALTSSIPELGGVYSTEDNNGPDDHSSMYGANPRIVAAPRMDGSFDVAWQTETGGDKIYVSHVEESSGTYSAAWHVEVASLGALGGLAVDENGLPMVVTASDERIAGDVEPSETHRDNIMALVRIGENCAEDYRQDLRTDFDGNSGRLPLYSPFTAGTSRLAVGGGTYVIHYSQNTEYDEGVTQRHQIGSYLVGSAATGALTDVQGNISHSFDQRLRFDGTDFISLSLGDASLRGIALSHTTVAGSKNQKTLFAIKGGDSNTGGGYNNTFTRLGNVARSKSGYVSTFSTEAEPTHPERVSFSRNVGLVHSPVGFQSIDQPSKYGVVIADTAVGNDNTESWTVDILDYWGTAATGNNQQVAWITDYADRLTAHAERPKLVRYGEDKFFIIWEKWTLDDYEATYAALTDEWGNLIEGPTSLGSARLPRGDDAFLINSTAAWLEGSGGNIILHLLDKDLVHSTQTL
jgi:hypothetical protein